MLCWLFYLSIPIKFFGSAEHFIHGNLRCKNILSVYIERRTILFVDFQPPRLAEKKRLRLQKTLKSVIIICFKLLIPFDLASVFYTSRAESVIPIQICLGPLYGHTYGQSTTIHMYKPTCTYIQTYILSHRIKPVYNVHSMLYMNNNRRFSSPL